MNVSAEGHRTGSVGRRPVAAHAEHPWTAVVGDGVVTFRIPVSTVTAERRSLPAWVPPNVDPTPEERYPVLHLQHGGARSSRDRVEVGRFRHIVPTAERYRGVSGCHAQRAPAGLSVGGGQAVDVLGRRTDEDQGAVSRA